MRTILYTGKGGTGKTSLAAATALLASGFGHRTLVLSTDVAHSLSDSFEVHLGPEPVRVTENLWGQEIDVYRELEVHWGTIQEWLSTFLRWQGVKAVVADELAVLPGMEELVSLLHVVHRHREKSFDLLVVDCAPTGETLRLLSLPEVARWYMRHFFPIEKRIVSTIAPLAKRMLNVPLPEEEIFLSVEELYGQLEEMKEVLQDSSKSSVRLVVSPEKMVIKEAQRSFSYLNLYSYSVDLVICNRVIGGQPDSAFMEKWREIQAPYLDLINEAFSPVPVLKAPLLPGELLGMEMLEHFGRRVFGDSDPSKIFYTGCAQRFLEDGKEMALELDVPFVSRDEITVLERGRELTIQAGKYRRHVFLPLSYSGCRVKEAVYSGNTLKIIFSKEEGSE